MESEADGEKLDAEKIFRSISVLEEVESEADVDKLKAEKIFRSISALWKR